MEFLVFIWWSESDSALMLTLDCIFSYHAGLAATTELKREMIKFWCMKLRPLHLGLTHFLWRSLVIKDHITSLTQPPQCECKYLWYLYTGAYISASARADIITYISASARTDISTYISASARADISTSARADISTYISASSCAYIRTYISACLGGVLW